MKPNDKAIEAAATSLFGNYMGGEKKWVGDAIAAAYTAQFHPSEDYAGLIKLLRSMHKQITSDMQNDDPCLIIDETVPSKAADALEAVLADRDALLAVNAELSVAFKERDEAIAERDALKADLASARDMTWFWEIVDAAGLNNVASCEQTALRELVKYAAERDALLARLAPVNDDEELVEIAAYYFTDGSSWSNLSERLRNNCRRDAREIIAAIRPHIEAAAERGRASKDYESLVQERANQAACAFAAAIRRGK